MDKISAVIIAKNEEEMIGPCIKSLKFCDEIIVINNGSKDNTKELSQKLGAKVIDIITNDFSELRTLGLQKAEFDWLLYVDADERIDEDLRNSIKEIISKNLDYSAFYLKRKNFYLGNNEWPRIEKLERLFKKDKLKGWKGMLHESPEYEGSIGILDGFILHYTHRSLETMLAKTAQWSTTEALLRLNSNHPKMTWWRFPRVMITAFLDSFIFQQGFKVGSVGLIEATFQAYSMFLTYAKLWEMQKLKEQKLKK